jgi:hypothetical protein
MHPVAFFSVPVTVPFLALCVLHFYCFSPFREFVSVSSPFITNMKLVLDWLGFTNSNKFFVEQTNARYFLL